MIGDPSINILGASGKGGAGHTSPYHQYSQVFTPKSLKELMRLCEYVFYSSPHIYAALRKFGEYPITKLIYNTTNPTLKAKYENVLEEALRIRELLLAATWDKFVYGNGFISLYQPFTRFLNCPHCQSRTNIQRISYTFTLADIKFTFVCPNCHKNAVIGPKGVIDTKLAIPRKMNFIRWDPKQITIDHNDITGESIYYYAIPDKLKKLLSSGNKLLIDTMPMGFIEAASKGKHFKFAEDSIYRLKIGGPAGICSEWGLPPLLSVLNSYHYTQVLRKANEAIALDHLVPFRVLHPAQASGQGDPISMLNLRQWQDNMKRNIGQWRRDPLHLMFAPVPLGVTQMGGQGRALLTLGEIQEAEKGMVSALGIPMEFIYGGLTGSGMEATLRLIENQLESHISEIKGLLQWCANKVGRFLGWETVDVGLVKFRLTDDVQNKQTVFGMWQMGVSQGKPIISNSTIAEMYHIDMEDENKKIKQEALDAVRQSKETEVEIQKLHQNLAQQAQEEFMQGSGLNYDQHAVMRAADEKAQEIMSVDPNTQRSMMIQLQREDFVLYSVVLQRLHQMKLTQQREQKQE
jgi:hypothetical protein